MSELESEVRSQTKECKEIRKRVNENTIEYDLINRKCSGIESSIYKNRSFGIRVISEEDVMEKPVSSLNREDAALLRDIVLGIQLDLQQCLQEQSVLSLRLISKNEEIANLSEELLLATTSAKGKKSAFDGSEGETSYLATIEESLNSLKMQERGIKKSLFSKEKSCKLLETQLSNANYRLDIASSLPHTREGPMRLLRLFTTFVRRTYTRLTGRLTRRNRRHLSGRRVR